MIAVNIQGGLGNQMFEYAFATALASRMRTPFLLDNTQSFILPKYFKTCRFFVWINKIPLLRRWYRGRIAHLRENAYEDWTGCWSSPRIPSNANAYYDGFFQSTSFFASCEAKIRKAYAIRKKYVALFEEKYGQMYRDNTIVALHVRRTDYLTHGKGKGLGADDVSLPIKYYREALREISEIERYKIVVVGDDMEWMERNFSDLPEVVIAHNDMIVDFQLLLNADTVICSNGTFAWWAAYLNPKPSKRVIVPKYFLGYHIGKEFPKGIYDGTGFTEIEW